MNIFVSSGTNQLISSRRYSLSSSSDSSKMRSLMSCQGVGRDASSFTTSSSSCASSLFDWFMCLYLFICLGLRCLFR